MRNDLEPMVMFSEPEVQRILARAVELEARLGTHFTADDLRQIAQKAGIDSHALERAISETTAVDLQPAPRDASAGMTSSAIAVLATTGAVLGVLAVGADTMPLPGSSAIAVFAPSGLYTIYRALRHPLREGFAPLLRELGVLFGSFTAAVIAMQGVQNASPAVTWSLVAGALACGVLSLRGARASGQVADAAPSRAP